jgi:hypothetical protein
MASQNKQNINVQQLKEVDLGTLEILLVHDKALSRIESQTERIPAIEADIKSLETSLQGFQLKINESVSRQREDLSDKIHNNELDIQTVNTKLDERTTKKEFRTTTLIAVLALLASVVLVIIEIIKT